jgi:hypothetical protein
VKLRQDEARQAEFQAEIHEASLNSAPPSEHM